MPLGLRIMDVRNIVPTPAARSAGPHAVVDVPERDHRSAGCVRRCRESRAWTTRTSTPFGNTQQDLHIVNILTTFERRLQIGKERFRPGVEAERAWVPTARSASSARDPLNRVRHP